MKVYCLYGALIGLVAVFSACSNDHVSYSSPDWNTKLVDYHNSKFPNVEDSLKEELNVYVDYSTCMKQANEDASGLFNQLLLSPILGAHPNYYSIKGSQISKESEDPNVLFKSIVEVPYADLKKAIETMADSDCESVIMTDGEYVLKNTQANWNEGTPYMAESMKKWLLRGHDIHILCEPYQEQYNGNTFNKKRFYIFFTDRCIKNNVYDNIAKRIKSDGLNIKSYHISCSHAEIMKDNGLSSVPSEMLAAKITPKGTYEIQEWMVNWETIENSMVYSNFDPITGEPMKSSAQIISGLSIADNCIPGFKINGFDMKAYSVSDEFTIFADTNYKYNPDYKKEFEVKDFVVLDQSKLNNGKISVMFADQNQYNPFFMESAPYNFVRLDFSIRNVEPTIDEYKDMFCFDDIKRPGKFNTSVYESIKQCMEDADVLGKINNAHLYSIYVQSPNRE